MGKAPRHVMRCAPTWRSTLPDCLVLTLKQRSCRRTSYPKGFHWKCFGLRTFVGWEYLYIFHEITGRPHPGLNTGFMCQAYLTHSLSILLCSVLPCAFYCDHDRPTRSGVEFSTSDIISKRRLGFLDLFLIRDVPSAYETRSAQ